MIGRLSRFVLFPDRNRRRKDKGSQNTMKTDTLKRGTAFFAVLLLIGVWCLSAGTLYSSAKSFSEMNDDAYVTDGSRGDRPGILGDENDARRDDAARTPAGALGGRENGQGNGGSGLTGGDIPGNTAEGDFTDGAAGGIGGDQPGNAGGNGSAVLGAQDFDGNTDGAGDPAGDSALRTFWGIVIALIVAAVILALVFLLMPKDKSTER